MCTQTQTQLSVVNYRVHGARTPNKHKNGRRILAHSKRTARMMMITLSRLHSDTCLTCAVMNTLHINFNSDAQRCARGDVCGAVVLDGGDGCFSGRNRLVSFAVV